jgi:hypothetical protein
MPRVQRLTLKQVQMLTPEQINKMTDSERARALTTVQDVLAKRQKRAAAAGVDLPGLQNYKPTSTRGLGKDELKQQLKFAIQASQNKTSSITGARAFQNETWNRIKGYTEDETLLTAEQEVVIKHEKRPSPEVWRNMSKEEKAEFNYRNKVWRLPKNENPLTNKRFAKNYWKVYDIIKNNTQGFGTENSWSSDTLQAYIMRKMEAGKYSDADIVDLAGAISQRAYEVRQQVNQEIEKEMEPWGYYGNNTDLIEIDGDEDLFDL